VVPRCQRVQHQQRETLREGELSEVEGQLDRGEPAVEHQQRGGPDHAAQNEIARIREQQAEHERKVAERERVRAAAELHVHHAALGHHES
jgi:hypothetical protein